MNRYISKLSTKLLHTCQRSVSVQAECKSNLKWLEPTGHKTKLTVYNPATKTVVPLILKNKDVLTWYACGPTVYDSAHIGHAVTYVKSDIIRRIISDFFNINVVMAMCITDVDDKIIQRSKEQGKPIHEITNYYTEEFFTDMEQLNVIPPSLYCKVSDHISDIIKFIQKILDQDMAYIAKDGSVYFDTNKYGKYGITVPLSSNININKRSQADFSLWKAAKEDEPWWEAPWGIGRPGWHIECSTIASNIFGNCMDIHSGGKDLSVPHHKNEEAQSCCYHEVDQWVNYWVHFGHLHLDGDVKMSKSLKNTVSIQDLCSRYTANQFRMLCLLSSYRNDLPFSVNHMKLAAGILSTIENFIGNCNSYIKGQLYTGDVDEALILECLSETKDIVNKEVANDFNTPQAVHALLQLTKTGTKMLNTKNDTQKSRSVTAIAAVSSYLTNTLTKFGITESKLVDNSKVNNIIDELVKFRKTVRSRALEMNPKDKKLLTACDDVRATLSTHGVTVNDIGAASVWMANKY